MKALMTLFSSYPAPGSVAAIYGPSLISSSLDLVRKARSFTCYFIFYLHHLIYFYFLHSHPSKSANAWRCEIELNQGHVASGWLEGFPPPSTAACFASSASGGGLLLAKPRLLGDKGLKRSAIIILFGYLLTQPLQESGHDIVLFNLLPIALKAIHWLPFLGLQRATTHFCKLWQMFPPSHSFLPSLCLGFG